VFIYNRGSYAQGNSIAFTDRVILVGILSDTGITNEKYEVKGGSGDEPRFVTVSKELGIGFAFNDKAIAETINYYLKSKGLPTRAGLC
jgi:hypothetical protein